MKNTQERRAFAAAWRALHSTGQEQIRALDRLASLTDEVAALEVWLMTKPDPAIVDQAITLRLLRWSPLYNVMLAKPVNWPLAGVVKFRPTLEVKS
jgi:hypothetical protein